MSAIQKYNICKENCNGILTNLYKKRDSIGQRISNLTVRGYDVTDVESEYDNLVDEINEICNWRRNNPGCLTEGDPGFRFY